MSNYSPDLNIIFAALSDETRRAMIARLSRGPASVSELAAPHDMALPSILNHLDKLEKAGLIETSKKGRVRFCRLSPKGIAPAQHWLTQQEQLWESRLDQFDDYIEQLTKDNSRET